MSASDSGVILVAAPVAVTVGAVALVTAGIKYVAEQYRQEREREREMHLAQSTAEAERYQNQLDSLNALSDLEDENYRRELQSRTNQEQERRRQEDEAKQMAEARLATLQQQQEHVQVEIRTLMERMERDIASFQQEFGEDQQVQDMAEAIRTAEKLFGGGKELLQDLKDLVEVVLPGMTEKKRRQLLQDEMEKDYRRMAGEHMSVRSCNVNFVSLNTGVAAGRREQKTPWELFVEQLQSAAEIEQLYYETEAEELLEEALEIPAQRRNFFLQQNQNRLEEIEQRCNEYLAQQEKENQQTKEALCRYLSLARAMNEEPQFTRADMEDLSSVIRMRDEIERLTQAYQKRKEREYISNAITTVMARHQLRFERMTVDDYGREELSYALDRQTGVQITRSATGAFEMQFQGTSQGAVASMDERRTITEKARHFCSLLPSIVETLREEFGITFEKTALQPPDMEHIQIRQNTAGKRVASGSTWKEQQMNSD